MTGPDGSTSGTAVPARLPAAEFRAVVAAEVLSVLGDRFSKIALTVTVYDRNGSAALGGLAHGLTFFTRLLDLLPNGARGRATALASTAYAPLSGPRPSSPAR